MRPPSRDTSYSEFLRSLAADERRFRQALQSTPAPGLATSFAKLRRLLLADLATPLSKLHKLVLADVDRFRTALQTNLRSLLVADVRRFKQALRFTPVVRPSPSLANSFSRLRRLLPADVRRFRQVRSEILMLLVADLRRFRTAVGFPPALNLELERMYFYEWGPGRPANWKYLLTTCFRHKTTCYIVWEVRVKNTWDQRDRLYPLVCRYYKSDGSLLGEVHREWVIKAYSRNATILQMWGWPNPGRWTPGEYEARLLIEGVEFAKSRFTIEPPEPPEPPRPPAENLRLTSVRFYTAGGSHKEVRRDGVRFPHATTREVICELTVQNLLYQQRNQTYDMTAQCYTAEEKLLWEDHHDWLIKSEEQEPSITWGWQAPGQWEAGAYRVEILINGAEFAWGAFAIEEPPPTQSEPKNTPERTSQRGAPATAIKSSPGFNEPIPGSLPTPQASSSQPPTAQQPKFSTSDLNDKEFPVGVPIRTWWNRLTEEDLIEIGNQKDRLSRALRARYGYSRERAQQEIELCIWKYASGKEPPPIPEEPKGKVKRPSNSGKRSSGKS